MSRLQKVLVTGATGQLGSELKQLSDKYAQLEWIFADRTVISLDNTAMLKLQLAALQPDIILNCAAYTAVDKAETETELANQINHLAVGVIAEFAKEKKVRMIHISTDYVFDGNSAKALTEDTITNPINVYGETKRAGELACLATHPEAIIIRTSWVYSRFGNNFVKTMQRLLKERDLIKVVDDQIGSPTYAVDLAQVMLDIITAPKWTAGIYHFSNEGEISWHQFVMEIQEITGDVCEVIGIPSSDYSTAAKRPAFSLLDKSKIKNVYGVAVPDYKESLRKCLNSQS